MHKNNLNKLILSYSLILIAQFGYAQIQEIKIRYIGNCGLHITDGTTHIYTDFPYQSGAYNYVEYDESEIENLEQDAIYIFTHKHRDHYYRGKMKGILKRKNGTKYGKWNIKELENLQTVIPNFKIQAFKTKHHYSQNHYSYLITWHGKRLFLSGDTESCDTISTIKDLDLAFVPAWLISDLVEKDKSIDSAMIVIYHIGPRDEIDITGPGFLMLKEPGKVMTIGL